VPDGIHLRVPADAGNAMRPARKAAERLAGAG